MYYVVYGFLWLISLLPLRILYILSDGLYGIIFYVLKYRRAVALQNLRIAFPEKTEAERLRIAKKFYRNLIDTFIETIKMLTVSRRFLLKRFTANWEEVNKYRNGDRSLQILLGHNFNWEWGNSVGPVHLAFPFLVVYMPMSSKIFNRLMLKLRTRSGSVLLRATNMSEDFLPYRNSKYMLGLVADQNPGYPGNAWWFRFFGRPTPFVKGPSRAAVMNNLITVFAFIHKPRRGYYEAVFWVADENPSQSTEQELTGKFVRYLEEVIRQYPEMWLWTHRRWKHEWKPEYGEIIA